MIIRLAPERIKKSDKQKWKIKFLGFLSMLTESKFELTEKNINIMDRRPSKRTEPCEVIQLVKEV